MPDENSQILDAVIVGAGLAGLTTAYRLRDKNILVLEKEDVCGGRTISRKMGEYVFNTGAQVVLNDEGETSKLAREIGVEKTLIDKTRMPMHMKGKLITAPLKPRTFGEPLFLWRLPIPIVEKVKMGLKVLRIRSRYSELVDQEPDPGNPKTQELCAETLEDFMDAHHPDIRAIWDTLSKGANTATADEVAAFQPINTFLHFAEDEYYVTGGTWELTRTLWDHVRNKTETSATVDEITHENGAVRVSYDHAGQRKTVTARRCVIAIPAPLVSGIVKDMPDWKREAMEQVDFGSMTSAGFLLSENSEKFLGEGVWRVPIVGKKIISVTNPTFTFPKEVKRRTGQGLLRAYTGDKESKELQQMSDGEALEVLTEDLISAFPDIAGKIIQTSIKHWPYAISPWRIGRLEIAERIKQPTGRIHYCGDYTVSGGLEAAILSAYRVLDELQKEPAA
jgi:oxygen-dependent protoporphyrinogen oxidase